MRILKNILIYALPALMLCNTSCDYLDKEPENKVPEENVDLLKLRICIKRFPEYMLKLEQAVCTG